MSSPHSHLYAAYNNLVKPVPVLWPVVATMTKLLAGFVGVKSLKLESEFYAIERHEWTEADYEDMAALQEGMGVNSENGEQLMDL